MILKTFFAQVQCYKSAGYCWCVHEDTGKNIPGTSVKNQTPKCDQIAAVSRPMKGCPEEKKITFLGDLMDHFHAKMAKETNGTNMAGLVLLLLFIRYAFDARSSSLLQDERAGLESVARRTSGDVELRGLRQEQEQDVGEERVEGVQGRGLGREEPAKVRQEVAEVL